MEEVLPAKKFWVEEAIRERVNKEDGQVNSSKKVIKVANKGERKKNIRTYGK